MSVTTHGQDAELAVLIVDDEPALASSLAAGLTAAQHHPIVATSAEDALRHVALRPDIGVVITDLRMPDRNGLDLAQEIIAGRREEEALEVIVISGHATMETAATAVSARVSALLYKPFRLGAMVRAVDDAAAQARRRRAASAASRRNGSRLAALETERRQLLEWLDQARERLGSLPLDPCIACGVEHEVAALAEALAAPIAADDTPAADRQDATAPDPLGDLRRGVERSSDLLGLLEELQGLTGQQETGPIEAVDLAAAFDVALRFRTPDFADQRIAVARNGWDAPRALATPRPLDRALDRCLQAVIACAVPGATLGITAHRLVQHGRAWAAIDFDLCPGGPDTRGQLAFEIASRRAEGLGGRFDRQDGGTDKAIFRLALPAAPPR